MITLAIPDIVVIFLYFAAVVFVGFRTVRRARGTEEDFLLAGRTLTLPIFVMTLVSTWYGGILGVGEFTYRYGIANWVVQGLPYYVFAAVFAYLFAERVRATNLYSIPDKLAASYDSRTAIAGSFLTFILMTPAPYILMLSVFLQMLFGWSLLLSLIVTAVVAISYLYTGGFRSDVETDVLEFILMFIGFAVILPYSYHRYGGSEFLQSHLPPLHLTWSGGNSVQYIIVWFFIALWTLVDPAFHQRCYAAKSGSVAKKGILLSIPFWCFFDFMTVTAGLYARAALPGIEQPVMAYPLLAQAVLPPIAKGLFYVGMLATIMSTLNTLAFVSAQTLGRDIWLRWRRPQLFESTSGVAGERIALTATKVGLIISFLFSVLLAVAIPSVVQIWYTIGTVIIPGLLVPIVAGYFPRLSVDSRTAFYAMIAGVVVSGGWLTARYLPFMNGLYPLGIEPMYPGLFISIALWARGKLASRNLASDLPHT